MKPLLFACLLLVGCATTPEAKRLQAERRVEKATFAFQPGVYDALLREGKINAQTHHEWKARWNEEAKRRIRENAAREKESQRIFAAYEAKRAREWATLTPAQRADLEMRGRELRQQQAMMEWQAQQLDQQRRAAIGNAIIDASQTYQQNMQRAAEQNQQRLEATRPRSFHVQDNGLGNVSVTPSGY